MPRTFDALEDVVDMLETHRVQLHPELNPRSDPSPVTRCERCRLLHGCLMTLVGQLLEPACA